MPQTSFEDEAREICYRAGFSDAHNATSGDLVELANILRELKRLQSFRTEVQRMREYQKDYFTNRRSLTQAKRAERNVDDFLAGKWPPSAQLAMPLQEDT